MSGQIQETYTVGNTFNTATTGGFVPLDPRMFPFGIAKAVWVNANTSGLQLLTLDGATLNLASAGLTGNLIPITFKAYQLAGGSVNFLA